MSCILSSDFTLPCRRSMGGIQKVFITELGNTTTLTVASGVATTFTLAGSKKFFTYNLTMGGSSATATIGGDRAVGSRFFTHLVQIQLPKFETAIRNEIAVLGQVTSQIIVLDSNGKYFLYGGYRGLEISEGSGQTGTASADLSGFNISFSGDELDFPIEVPSALMAALTA